MIKRICKNNNNGTAKLNTDKTGSVFGGIKGMANEAKNNKAKMLLIKKIILFKNERFFIKPLLIFSYFKQKVFVFFT